MSEVYTEYRMVNHSVFNQKSCLAILPLRHGDWRRKISIFTFKCFQTDRISGIENSTVKKTQQWHSETFSSFYFCLEELFKKKIDQIRRNPISINNLQPYHLYSNIRIYMALSNQMQPPQKNKESILFRKAAFDTEYTPYPLLNVSNISLVLSLENQRHCSINVSHSENPF